MKAGFPSEQMCATRHIEHETMRVHQRHHGRKAITEFGEAQEKALVGVRIRRCHHAVGHTCLRIRQCQAGCDAKLHCLCITSDQPQGTLCFLDDDKRLLIPLCEGAHMLPPQPIRRQKRKPEGEVSPV